MRHPSRQPHTPTRFASHSPDAPSWISERSTSRGSFVGQSRMPIMHHAAELDARAPPSATRWHSESRTVWGSFDESPATVAVNPNGHSYDPVARTHAYSPKHLSKSRSRSQSRRGRVAPAAAAFRDPHYYYGTAPNLHQPIRRPSPQPPENQRQIQRDIEKGKSAKTPAPNSSREQRILSTLPSFISHFLGHRTSSSKPILGPLVRLLGPTLETWLWAWVGAFVSLGCIALIFTCSTPFRNTAHIPEELPSSWTTPVIIGSFGASSVLLFGAPASPLGQPWAFLGGQVTSAIIGVVVTKLFKLSSKYNLDLTNHSWNIVWVAGACSTATALLFMFLTNTVHPPGGATALLAATSAPVEHLGWRYIVVVMISSGVMLVWALLWMNLGSKRYPTQWYSGPGTGTGPDVVLKSYKWKKERVFAKRAARNTHSAGRYKKSDEHEHGGDEKAADALQTHDDQASSGETLRNRSQSTFPAAAAPSKDQNKDQPKPDVDAGGWLDETPWRRQDGDDDVKDERR
ncbi:hypothetical protein K437DRAFT_218998 [Tilletiaria anomala UBC 951]|uniref:HPP transmembrane region domain-containing protein n=1 Tax=Tilletiaria anomala (strain ATCC 24038 / CBS 436.72 / UBC 951) TaxID=1037660 RepID=A0A066WS06_TILAU|nr:uncharacterized protein K437DRAFT_218998 [Tilletiaria anomala UBC 951]KDN53455.1 hypothetical protein K437DRAFT_218998 [Tilletiaria anomala UBC 951]